MIADAFLVGGSWLCRFALTAPSFPGPFPRRQPLAREARPLWQAALWTVLLDALGVALKPELFADQGDAGVPADGHAYYCLELAIHRVLWALPSHCYVGPDRARTPHGVLPQRGSRSRTVLAMTPTADETPAVAASHLVPFCNNESGVTLVESALFRLRPQLTVTGLIHAMTWLKVACVAVFVLFLLRVGAGLLFSFLLFEAPVR